MQALTAEQMKVVSGGDGDSSSQPASCTTNSDGSKTCSCPTGTFPAQTQDGSIVCVKPNS